MVATLVVAILAIVSGRMRCTWYGAVLWRVFGSCLITMDAIVALGDQETFYVK